jgi:hypothetical protein
MLIGIPHRVVEKSKDESIGRHHLVFVKRLARKDGGWPQSEVEIRPPVALAVDGMQDICVSGHGRRRAVPEHEGRVEAPEGAVHRPRAAQIARTMRTGGLGQNILRVITLARAIGNEQVLDAQRLAQHLRLERLHVAAMNPDLADLHIRAGVGIAVVQARRGPHVVGQLVEAGRGVFVEEEDGVAEEHGDGNGAQDEGQPVSGSSRSILVEGPPEWMLGREIGGLGRSVGSVSTMGQAIARGCGAGSWKSYPRNGYSKYQIMRSRERLHRRTGRGWHLQHQHLDAITEGGAGEGKERGR